MKKCFKCGSYKHIDEFYKHPKMADGHLGKCKECCKKDNISNRNKNIKYYRDYDTSRSSLPKRREHNAKTRDDFRSKNPRAYHCHIVVNNAIRGGKMKKEPCIICGSMKSYAHNENYDYPLIVTWYCQPHHKDRHKQMVQLGIVP